jgi:hypothetical protein
MAYKKGLLRGLKEESKKRLKDETNSSRMVDRPIDNGK